MVYFICPVAGANLALPARARVLRGVPALDGIAVNSTYSARIGSYAVAAVFSEGDLGKVVAVASPRHRRGVFHLRTASPGRIPGLQGDLAVGRSGRIDTRITDRVGGLCNFSTVGRHEQ